MFKRYITLFLFLFQFSNICFGQTDYEYAVLAVEAYNPPDITKTNYGYSKALENGWQYFDSMNASVLSTGYFGVAFKKNGRVVFAHRGTEPTLLGIWGDMLNDILLSIDLVPIQFSGVGGAKVFVETVKASMPTTTVYSHCGHSLGGLIAQLSGAFFRDNVVSFDSPGAKQIINNFIPNYGIGNLIFKNYKAAPNIINSTNEHVGQTIRVFPNYLLDECYGTGLAPIIENVPDLDYFLDYSFQQHTRYEFPKLLNNSGPKMYINMTDWYSGPVDAYNYHYKDFDLNTYFWYYQIKSFDCYRYGLRNFSIDNNYLLHGYDINGNDLENLIWGATNFNDRILALDGDDLIYGFEGNDYIDGGNGKDGITYEWYSEKLDNYKVLGKGININLTTGIGNKLGLGIDNLKNIENVIGSDFDDLLTGDAKDNELQGGLGNDIIDGKGGNNRLKGNQGEDRYLLSTSINAINNIIDEDGGILIIDEKEVKGKAFDACSPSKLYIENDVYLLKVEKNQTTGGENLIVSKQGFENAKFIIENWKNGDFGLSIDKKVKFNISGFDENRAVCEGESVSISLSTSVEGCPSCEFDFSWNVNGQTKQGDSFNISSKGTFNIQVTAKLGECTMDTTLKKMVVKQVCCNGQDNDGNGTCDTPPPPNDDCITSGGKICIPTITPRDPNEIKGLSGYGTSQWVSKKQKLEYTVLFENDPELATAPAQQIKIEVPISPKLNPASFRVGDFGFRNLNFSVPLNAAIYTNRLDVRDSLGVFVDVTAGIDIANRKAFWTLQAIDPATGLASTVDPLMGILPVNDSLTNNGEGYVTFSILPLSSVVTKDSLLAKASIIFDTEATIITNTWVNIVDAVAPTSQVTNVLKIADKTAKIDWTGQDDAQGVGVDFFDLYVSKNAGPFTLFKEKIKDLYYEFIAEKSGEYAFFTIASDFVGNRENSKNASNKKVFLGTAPPIISSTKDTLCSSQSTNLIATNCSGLITWSNGQTGSSISVSIAKDSIFTAKCTVGGILGDESEPIKLVYGGAIPTATLASTQTINLGETAILDLAFTGNSPWHYTLNGEVTSNITSSNYQLGVSPSNNTTYTLTSVGNICGNFNVTNNNIATVTVNGGQSLVTSVVTGSPFCAGTAVSVGFNATGTFVSGNIFTAQLSNATGSFATGTINIGSITSTATSGTIAATIPINTISGTAYRIRVISSNPLLNGTDNGADLTIRAKATASLSGSQTITAGQTATITATLTGTSPWAINVNGQNYPNITSSPYSITINPATTTTYSLTNVSDVCGAENVTTNNTAIITVGISSTCIPQKIWDKTLGGSLSESLSSVVITSDGGYILGGSSPSNISGDKSQNSKGSSDFWIVKIDANGIKQWDKTYGGNNTDILKKIIVTNDGFLLGGYSNSTISGDKTENSKGDYDYWLVKINEMGEKQWDKTLGGDNADYLSDILPLANNEYLIGGSSNSGISGIKSESSKGFSDFWILKINGFGVKQWDKTFGGNSNESLNSMLLNNDGNFLLAGDSYSYISGDKSEDSKGANDFWLINVNSFGLKVWDKTFGGNNEDYLSQAINTNDGGFILAGFSYSGLSGDKSENTKGANDYWIVKLNSIGSKEWDKTIGGAGYEELSGILKTNDGNYLLGGVSSSNISGDKTTNSYNNTYDYWTVKISSDGLKLWDKTIGTTQYDYFSAFASLNDGSILLSGITESGISDDKTEVSRGGSDYWIVKMKESCCLTKSDLIVSDVTITKYTPTRVNFTTQIKNIGTTNASMSSFFLGVYTSSDELVNANDVWKYSITTGDGTLVPNQTLNFLYNTSFNFTDNQYYLRLKADDLGLITECDETNNNLFKLVNKCTTTGNLNLTGTISSGYYATNQAVTITNAALSDNVLVVGKSISGTPALTALNSVFMIGGCLNAPTSNVVTAPTIVNKPKPIIEFLETDSKQIVEFILTEELPTTIYIWNATTKTKLTTIQEKTKSSKGLNTLDLTQYGLNKTDIFILNIETSHGIYARVID